MQFYDKKSNSAKMRVAVAELCGWALTGNIQGNFWQGIKNGEYGLVPDYCNDLNACVEFEEILLKQDNDLMMDYDRALGEITPHFTWHAKADEKCEAFLRVMKPEFFNN